MTVYRNNDDTDIFLTADNTPACGTTACLAGTLVWQNRPEVFQNPDAEIEDEAYDILEVDDADQQALLYELFHEIDVIDHSNILKGVRVCKEGGLEAFEEWVNQIWNDLL